MNNSNYDISLAVMVLKLCWDIDDVIYLKVNAQPKQKGLTLSKNAKETLYSLNEPDYVLYDHFNKTLWKTVDELGRERVEVRDSPTIETIHGPFSPPDHLGWVDPKLALANEISQRSLVVADECIGGVELVEGDGEKQKTTSEYILKKNKGKVKKSIFHI